MPKHVTLWVSQQSLATRFTALAMSYCSKCTFHSSVCQAEVSNHYLKLETKCTLVHIHLSARTQQCSLPPRGQKCKAVEVISTHRICMEWLKNASPSVIVNDSWKQLGLACSLPNRKVMNTTAVLATTTKIPDIKGASTARGSERFCHGRCCK